MAIDTGYTAATKWKFDAEVTRVFSNMLERSIPQYETMRSVVFEMATRFVQKNTYIVDLGTSRGDALAPLWRSHGATANYLGVEVSPPMIKAARERFSGAIDAGFMEIAELDLRNEPIPPRPASVVQAVLCLCFVPVEYRQRIIREAYDMLLDGGAILIVEKVLGDGSNVHDMMTEIYREKKRRSGYDDEQIERKRLALEGVLVPDSASTITNRLRDCNFREVECFWRWLNFAAFIGIK